jgi:hypothetical protein
MGAKRAGQLLTLLSLLAAPSCAQRTNNGSVSADDVEDTGEDALSRTDPDLTPGSDPDLAPDSGLAPDRDPDLAPDPDRDPDRDPDLAPDPDPDPDPDLTPDGDDLEGRSEEAVCRRWNEDHRAVAPFGWTPGEDDCDPGTLDPRTIEDAVVRTNLFRWLVGLPPIVDDAELNRKAQLCAVIQRSQGFLSHSPSSDVACYTADGAEAAASSNIAQGVTSPAAAVDLYISDIRVESLGHRRWIFQPSYNRGGFSQVGTSWSDGFSCQWVFGWGGTANPRFTVWPNPGPSPIGAGVSWSFSAGSVSFDGSVGVEVVRVSDNHVLPTTPVILEGGFGPNTISFDPEGWTHGETYEVRITGAIEAGLPTTLTYRTTPTRCD